MTEEIEKIYIGHKKIKEEYVPACLYPFKNGKTSIKIVGRGNNIKPSVDVADILLREEMDVKLPLPTLDDLEQALDNEDLDELRKLINKMKACEIRIGSEKYGERNVSTIEIIVRGKIKYGSVKQKD